MLLSFVLLVVGLTVLVFGADLLVKGAQNLAVRLGVSPLVVGLTVVAFGTSAPELCVSVAAALNDKADVAVGNVLGSNLFNILVIIGLTAVISPVRIARSIRHREMPIMLLSLVLTAWFSLSGVIGRVEGAILFGGILLYLIYSYLQVRYGQLHVEEQASESSLKADIVFVLLGLVGLVAGAELSVQHAVIIATFFGVSEFVIAVTLIAVGTSLPELATTLVAAARGEPDLAVGNAVGSNIFNVFCVLGATGLVVPIPVSASVLQFDGPFMIAACFFVWGLMWIRMEFNRLFGVLMLTVYLAYLVGIILTGGAGA